MSRCYYFCFCLYGLILFTSSPTLGSPVTKGNVLTYEENKDYTVADDAAAMNMLVATMEPEAIDEEVQTGSPPKVEIVEAVKKTGNTTVIIVFVAFALTMIVKGVPVVIAYSIPYFSKSEKQVGEEGDPSSQLENESKSESDDSDGDGDEKEKGDTRINMNNNRETESDKSKNFDETQQGDSTNKQEVEIKIIYNKETQDFQTKESEPGDINTETNCSYDTIVQPSNNTKNNNNKNNHSYITKF